MICDFFPLLLKVGRLCEEGSANEQCVLSASSSVVSSDAQPSCLLNQLNSAPFVAAPNKHFWVPITTKFGSNWSFLYIQKESWEAEQNSIRYFKTEPKMFYLWWCFFKHAVHYWWSQKCWAQFCFWSSMAIVCLGVWKPVRIFGNILSPVLHFQTKQFAWMRQQVSLRECRVEDFFVYSQRTTIVSSTFLCDSSVVRQHIFLCSQSLVFVFKYF